jgi:hypothetical protein
MAATWRYALFVAALATSASAEDPPPGTKPAAHQNKVSPAAKAAADRFDHLVYRPAEHGLKTLSAVLGAGTAPSRPLWQFQFNPPDHPKLTPSPGAKPSPAQTQAAEVQLAMPLRAAYEGVPLFDEKEYDADVVERDGLHVLAVTSFRGGAKLRTTEFTLNDEGLLDVARPVASADGVCPVMKLAWEKVGDRRRIASIDLTVLRGAEVSAEFAYTLAYADVAGVNVETSFVLKGWVTEAGKKHDVDVSVRLDSLTVNGKPDDRPRPGAHANKISPEAKAAIDAYAKLVYRSAEHGLVSMSGTIVPAWMKTPAATTFEFKAPNLMNLAAAADGKPAPGFHRFALFAAIDAVRIGESTEFDAELVEKDGRRTVEVVEYRAGAKLATTTYVLDADGLVSSLTRLVAERTPQAADVVITLKWAKFGGLYRVEHAELASVSAEKQVSADYAFTYATVDGMSIVTSYVRTVREPGKDAKEYPYRIDDLVVNGKKVDTTKPATPPADDGGK